MKINGVDPQAPVTDYVVIPRGDAAPIKLKIRALALGADDVGNEIFPVPVPPMRPVPDGKPVKAGALPTYLFDNDNRLILRPDPKDPGFVKEMARRTRGFAAYVISQGLSLEPSVVFETPLDLKKKDPAAYYLKVADEMNESGLSLGDVALILDGIMRLSNMDQKRIAKAREDFFLAEAAASAT